MPQTFDTPLFSSDQSIDRVLNAGLPVVLVFLDGPPSTALSQSLKELAKQEAGQLLVVQLDLKDSPQTARRYGVQSLPALVTVKNSQVHSQAENIDADELVRHARYLLGKGPKPEPKVQRAAGAYATAGAAGGYSAPPQPAYTPGGNGPSGGGLPVTVTDATFEQEVMRSTVPVVVDFWAPWCGPCRMVAPVLEMLAREWNGRVKIAKINVDENPQAAGRHGVQAIPTMMVVKDGQIVERWAGALPEPALRNRLSSVIQ